MENIDQVVRVLREHGFKITPQRMAILEILQGNTTHPSAEDIFKRLLKKYPSVSLTTVYNTLDTLLAVGQLQELNIDRNRRHYDPDISEHSHMICSSCGKIFDVFQDFQLHRQLSKEIRDGFDVRACSVQFIGICKRCVTREKH